MFLARLNLTLYDDRYSIIHISGKLCFSQYDNLCAHFHYETNFDQLLSMLFNIYHSAIQVWPRLYEIHK